MYEVVLRSEIGIYAYHVCKEESYNNKDNNDNKQQQSAFQKRHKTCTQKRICPTAKFEKFFRVDPMI